MTTIEAAQRLQISAQMVGEYARRAGLKPVERYKAGKRGFAGRMRHMVFDFSEADLETIRACRAQVKAADYEKRVVTAKRNREKFRPELHVPKAHLDHQNRIRQHDAWLREPRDYYGNRLGYKICACVVQDPQLSSPIPGGPQMMMVQWRGFTITNDELREDDCDLTTFGQAREFSGLKAWNADEEALRAWQEAERGCGE